MLFKVFGPYRLPRTEKGLIAATAQDRRDFWDEIDEEVPGLSYACGCYVFSIKAMRGSKPWYVGKSEKSEFRRECLTSHKVNHYDNAIVGRKGYPELSFIAQVSPKGNFRSPTTGSRRSISELETMLIGMGVSRNRDMFNIKGTKMFRELEVEGVLNTGRLARGGPASYLRKLFKI